MQGRFVLGVDGGGTHCRIRIRTSDGTLVAEAEGGAANVNQNRHQACANILTALNHAAHIGGLETKDFALMSAGLGLAGITSRAMALELEEWNWPFANVRVDDDAYIACLGAHHGADGGILIAGTGSAGLCLVRGQRFAIGGRGFALGDDGSGAQLGRSALRAAMRALDGLIPATHLTDQVLGMFNHDASEMAKWGVTATPRDYAQFAPHVFAAALNNDPLARALAKDAARALDELARRLLDFGAPHLCLVGGLAEPIRPYLTQDIAAVLSPPLSDPLEGAILMAQQNHGPRA